MKSQLNRELVEGLIESSNEEYSAHVCDIVNGLMSSAIENIATQSPFVRLDRCVLLPVNEVYTGALTQLSEYDFFLGIDNKQIEFNSKTKKHFWRFAWREFKAAWRLGKKRYKRLKKANLENRTVEEIEKYKISDFRSDIVRQTAECLSTTSILYEHMRHISIVGKEDFGTGTKINVYIALYDGETNTFKLYNEIKNKYTTIDFGSRFENAEYKTNACGKMYVSMLKILNAMFSHAYNRVPNQILIESLVFNCPSLLFVQNDLFRTFVNVANYITLTNPKDFTSICDPKKNIFEEPLILNSGSQVDFGKVISLLENFKY